MGLGLEEYNAVFQDRYVMNKKVAAVVTSSKMISKVAVSIFELAYSYKRVTPGARKAKNREAAEQASE